MKKNNSINIIKVQVKKVADLLKVTTPLTGTENSTRTNPIRENDPSIQNIVDPSKVVRPDGREGVSTDTQRKALNYESNYETFMQMVRDTPALTQMITDLIYSRMGIVVSSGMGENFTEEISNFMEMLKMTEGELVYFLKNQAASAVKFKGAFFNVLRQILDQASSVELRTSILDFLKRYNDMSAGPHLMNQIMQNLQNIRQSIPRSYGDTLAELMTKLYTGSEPGNTTANTAVLKNEIIPYLSKYVSATYDLGKARDWMTMLTLNIARYENGDKVGFLKSFSHLMSFASVREKLGDISPEQLGKILANTEFERATEQYTLLDKLTEILERGMNGTESSHEAKAVFANIINSLLLNESVYMPLLHLMVPADIGGRLMFSEMWIDPDDQPQNGGSNGEREKQIRLFIKFDIKEVGYFEMILLSRDENVDIQLYYPEKLSAHKKMIQEGMSNIMERNGLRFQSLYTDVLQAPKTISEVFPKLYERMNAVNVRI